MNKFYLSLTAEDSEMLAASQIEYIAKHVAPMVRLMAERHRRGEWIDEMDQQTIEQIEMYTDVQELRGELRRAK